MGKKPKVGKARKDKFYQLAKETGYRSRASFKLLQLNRKFEFLQKSRVVIDLCAAPGGWLQVVSENTPISSIILGVDLVSIKPIKNCKTFQEDITTEKCRHTLRKELHTWKADCVLNDGAPNLGKSWLHDAFQQVTLTLHAVKLATEFLRKGGWFVTKVFRSKDYNSLMWVFQQLFAHVHATKPQASRTESAEIFVVCQGYLAPDKLDPKFFDAKYVFKEIEEEKKASLDLIHPEKKKRNREGYRDGDHTLFHSLKVSQFFEAENYLERLADASELVLDDTRIANHILTTDELKECLKDIKVLGKKDIKNIITWRKKIKKEFEDELKPAEEKIVEVEEENEEEAAQAMIAACKDEERRKVKRKLKKIREQKTKLRQKMDSKMVLPSDKMNLATDDNYFKLDKVKSKDQLRDIDLDAEDLDSGDGDEDEMRKKNKYLHYEREDKSYLDSDSDELEFEEEPNFSDQSDNDEVVDKNEEEEENPLVVELEPAHVVVSKKTQSWFSKESFADIGEEDEEDEELDKMVSDYKKKGGTVLENGKKSEKRKKTTEKEDNPSKKRKEEDSNLASDSGVEDTDESDSSDGDDSDSDSEYDEMEINQLTSNTAVNGETTKQTKIKNKAVKNDGFEVVPAEDLKLDAVGLAIGAKMVSSRKKKRDIIDDSYHRYMFDDENLPSWFVEDEAKHTERQLPVTKAEIEEYKLKMKAIDAQPIKKVAEAKARKKRKAAKKLEKVRRKAEVITEDVDVSEKEKWQQIKQLYKKAGLLKKDKKEVTYVVGKRGVGKRVSRPSGVTGPFKVVDPRMKKDKRKSKMAKKKGGKNNNRKRR
ncbi:hypothetical protein SNE40_002440 [Patella caerulea]|uniref:Putative rRNA methyltransferase n=1 Tax=Patella caerulea TaxID=87958 RepID=A0AAN8K615_PATCE